jgi:voltage-gated potassium channel Kch
VVLGTALLMEEVGLSMAMGAFLAGVILAESNFRHQLEADIEPFRGILLGLFFMAVGMSIDAAVVRQQWLFLLLATPAVIAVKIGLVAILFRAFRSPWRDGIRAGTLLAPAGEFAFVILPLGASLAVLTPAAAQFLTALAALTMFLGPLVAKGADMILARIKEPAPEPDLEGLGEAQGRVIVIGFGRFGQVVNQVLLAEGIDVTVIDSDVEQIRNAARFGFRVYYGDGTRLDVLRAAGMARAELVCICIDDRADALKIVEILHEEFPEARTYVRAYDRIHAIDLMTADVDFQVRETFESALAFSRAMLEGLGLDPARAGEVVSDVRRRDIARLMMQKSEGIMGGADLLHGVRLAPEPLTDPLKKAHGLSEATRDIIGEDGEPR